MSMPSNSIVPAVGSMSRSRSRPTVVLPQPDSPTRPSVSPRRISKLTPSTAWTTADRALQDAAVDREVLDEVAHLDEGRARGRPAPPGADGYGRRLGAGGVGSIIARPAGSADAARAEAARPRRGRASSGRRGRGSTGSSSGWTSSARSTSSSTRGEAARGEPAARRQVDQVGDVARDDRQLVA